MPSEKPDLDAIVCAAVEIPAADDRAAYVARACGDDLALRQAVEQLVDAHFRAGSFLERPAAADATGDFVPTDGGGVIGPYKLLQKIGEGGMGTVFMAEQTEPVRRVVALKLIKPGMDSRQVLARFEAERQALALMDHPNVAKVLDAGTSADGRPYFVMELVKGVPITRHCDDRRLTPRQRLDLMVPVCHAVQHAHQKGIIHRDLKPSNVLVALYDGKPVPKVIDFGVAKAAGPRLTDKTLFTEFGAVVGTLEYMSPEQAELNQLDIDTRSDVYALGVLLYELLTGTTPLSRDRLKGAALLEMLRVIREEEPPTPSTRLSTADELPSIAANRGLEPKKLSGLVRGELDWIVMKCLEKDRARRYDTANGLALDLLRYLADEAVLACPPSARYRLRKFVRRNRGAVLAASAVVAALLAGVVGTAASLVEARRQRDAADAARQDEGTQRGRAVANAAAADAERAKAVAAEQQTRAALDAMTDTVVEDLLARKEKLGEKELAFLRKVHDFYERLTQPDGDAPAARWLRAQVAYRLGSIRGRLGDLAGAKDQYRRAIDLLGPLADGSPAAPQFRHRLADVRGNLGNLLRREGALADAELELRQAIAEWEKLAAAHPAAGYRRDLGRGRSSLGNLLAARGKHGEAEAEHRRAVEVLDGLAAELPAAPDALYEAATGHHNLALVLSDTGRRGPAEEHYRRAAGLLEPLLARRPADPEHRRLAAVCWDALGNVLAARGDGPAAVDSYRRALAANEVLVGDYPGVPIYLHGLVGTHNNLANALRTAKDLPAAEDHYRRAVALGEKIDAQFPDTALYRQRLGVSRHNLAVVLSNRDRAADAEAEFRRALAVRERLTADHPATAEYRLDLAESQVSLGVLLARASQWEEAERHYRQAVAGLERLAADAPTVTVHQTTLAAAYANFGIYFARRDRRADAIAWYDKALAVLTPLARQDPRDVKVRTFVRSARNNRAVSLDALERFAEAAADWAEVAELSPPAERPAQRLRQGLSLARAGDHAAAARLAEPIAAAPDAAAAVLYRAAGVFARAAGAAAGDAPVADRYAARAVETLRRASAKGYRDADGAKKDANLDPLRGRPDFRQWLADLDRPAERAPKPPEDHSAD